MERDPRLAAKLARRTADLPSVRVVQADLRTVPLPRRPFHVVANPPFATSTALLRRILGDPRCPLAGADVLVEWGFARRLTEAVPRDRELARWRQRYELVLVERVPASCFSPPPGVDAAHLAIRPR